MTELLLVPDSLLQFTTLHFDLASFRERVEQDYIFSLVSNPASKEQETLVITRNSAGKRVEGEEIFLNLEGTVAKLFEGRWIPLPWLNTFSDSDSQKRPSSTEDPTDIVDLQGGPSNWIRGRLKKDSTTKQFFMEIVIDTTMERTPSKDPEGNPIYNGPKPDDNGAATYALPPLTRIKDWLSVNHWVQNIIFAAQAESVKAYLPSFDDDTPPPPRPGDLDHRLTALAAYLALLQGLTADKDLPVIKFVDNATKPIDVDLVLDLGNSRSSGILIEQNADQALSKNGRFGNCRVLGLRDLRAPQTIHSGLFSSRIEFSNITFGDVRLSRESGRDDAFLWPSPVRVGGEAEEMMAAREGTEGFSGLASPKRYLWDRTPTSQGWYFNDALTSAEAIPPHPAQNPRVSGSFRSKLHEILMRQNERGITTFSTDLKEELYDGANAGPDITAARKVKVCQLSKSEISILMLNELILQAIAFMNSPQERESREQSRTPRRLRSLVLAFPPGMPLAERRILTKRARTALTMAWESTRQQETWKQFGDAYTQPPELECSIDEATATQLVWLENEINNKMGGSVDEFFHLYGHAASSDGKERLRIASLDIGGGTTDLMVCDYRRNKHEEMLHPHQLFRESLRIAGDDLLEDIISGPIITAFMNHFRTYHIPEPRAFFNTLFKLGAADSTIQEATQRQLFISTILEPVALSIINAYENVETFFSGELITGRLHELHQISPKAAERTRDYFRAALKKHLSIHGTPSSSALTRFLDQNDDTQAANEDIFDPLDASIHVTTDDMEGIITRRLGQPLQILCSIVQAYGCDALLLSGRPSKLPHVCSLILSALPVAPQRVIPMHNYVITGDYPFSDSSNRIGDPKSTVVMGAVIWKKACRAEIGNFKLASKTRYEKSTAHFIGNMKINEGTIIRLFNPQEEDGSPIAYDLSNVTAEDKLEIKIDTFEGSMILGTKQLPNKDFPSSPFYNLALTSAGRDFLQQRRIDLNSPLSLTLSRTRTPSTSEAERKELCENLVITEIEGQPTTHDGPPIKVPARDFISATLQTTLTPQGHWRDTGAIHLTTIQDQSTV
ncbi:hypothetical protein GM608_00360 [Bombella sp. ESL0380]|uniref:virulence factor SrfB n=1 Tax=Bombella sp. ESL0380 TaxID=2676444 RepID=UPI0013259B56|nr:hypothetical protein [Bombella sp. ESL0380]MUH01955.1 hypothetical protein [Bombella sp. ESL0387]